MEKTLSIEIFADIIGAELRVSRYPNQKNRWSASFPEWQMRENESIVSGMFGDGENPLQAIQAFVNEIKGKKIETIQSEGRKSFLVPAYLTT